MSAVARAFIVEPPGSQHVFVGSIRYKYPCWEGCVKSTKELGVALSIKSGCRVLAYLPAEWHDRYAATMRQDELAEIDRAISALQDRTRRRILLDFYVHRPDWTVDDVAKEMGIHRTVAHGHLERLVALGYLVSGQRRGRYGKPAKLYRLAGPQIDLSYPLRRFARLASILADSMQKRGPDGIREARE